MIKLSDAEWRIMVRLWESSPKTITELTAELREETGWTKHTVISFLNRMVDKQAVSYQEGKRAKLYYPKIQEEEAQLQEAESFLQRVFRGNIGLMMNTMVDKKALSKGEIEELYEILRKAEEEK
ncbi:BlaI/MecI/CopY family transcriptional regulator [Alloiococcus sp. CFN-8]|uniref:BlaI/MecI/CopY family transcriptional regulator n=1 Tax=Alloiococcus sp. CFN-8 TaxID=3416081 RepID=UPI003CEA2653